MPTIRAKNPEYTGVDLAADVVVASGATGSHILASREGWESLRDSMSRTGFFRRRLHEAMDGLRLNLVISKTYYSEFEGYDVSVVFPANDTIPTPRESWYCQFIDAGSVTPVSSKPGITYELSPSVRSQVEQIVTGSNSKLQQRLSRFGSDCPGQEPVLASTMDAVKALVVWLCQQSDTVSATVSSDGMLSIAAVFPNDVRLYVEIERDGSAGAVISRSRTHADDLPITAVSQLTREMVLDAITSP